MTEQAGAERVQAYLDRLAAGEPADALRAAGAEATDLASARLAQALAATLPAQPPAPFRARLQADLQAELSRRHAPAPARRAAFRPRLWARLGAGALAVALLFASAVGASASSLPGDALYGLKRAVEVTRVRMAWDPTARIAIHLDIADARLREIAALRARARAVPPRLAGEVTAAHTAAQTVAAGSDDVGLAATVRNAVAADEAELRQLLPAPTPAVAPFASPASTVPPATATVASPSPVVPTATGTPRRLVRPTLVATQPSALPTPVPPPAGATEPPGAVERPSAPTAAPVSPATPTLSDAEQRATERAQNLPSPTLSDTERRATARAVEATVRAQSPTPVPTQPIRPSRTPRPRHSEPTRPAPGAGDPRPTAWPHPTRHP